MSSSFRCSDADSQSIAVILMVVITIILAALVLAICWVPVLKWDLQPLPAIFVITSIEHVDEMTGSINYDSRVILLHAGTGSFRNRDLKARFYKNGMEVPAVIVTMNGDDFISTRHDGVQWMGGMGCSGATWTPGERISIDFENGTFHPGDTVRVDIIDKTTGQPISRHVFHAG